MELNCNESHDKSCAAPIKPYQKSLTSYASSVFQESSIGMLSTIASTYSRKRKIFKSFILAVCLAGFLYQCITFLKVVFQYPTTVNVDIERPMLFDVPAYTFCNNNGIKRSIYCKTYPDHCEEANETFCKDFYPYCGVNTLVPKKEYLNIEHSMTYEEMLDIGDDLDDFLRENKNKFNITPVGPFIRSKDLEYGGMFCYSLNSVVNSGEFPLKTGRDMLFKEPANKLAFYVEDDEIFTPGAQPGVVFSIHSPYEAVNPFDKGIFLKPGRLYKIYIDMVAEILLQDPYPTDCENYISVWEKNNKSGPRIQEMCKHKCLLEASMKCFGCKMPLLLYPSNEKICTKDEWHEKICTEKYLTEMNNCLFKCKDDCQTTKYTFSVHERFDVKYSIQGDVLKNFENYIFVEIFLEAGEVMTLKHSPKYMTVEIFSSIGGFIGCWLGISLMDIADVCENFVRIFGYIFHRNKLSKNKI